jgi:hypothetical protein
VLWAGDSEHIRYLVRGANADGSAEASAWSIDIHSGATIRLPGDTPAQFYSAVALPDGGGYLRLDVNGSERHLVRLDDEFRLKLDLGVVKFASLGDGAWFARHRNALVLGVAYGDRDGLTTVPDTSTGRALAREMENLSHCSFAKGSNYGACVRESLASPPELVEVSLNDGKVRAMVRPNAAYGEIARLESTAVEWKNRYGFVSDGYVTYPRGYVRGKRYPTILVTHSHDARNRFAREEFQWEFPVEVYAEEGYLVLSANEPRETANWRSADNAASLPGSKIAEMQFRRGFNAVASMEAALQWAIDNELAEPRMAGIAGYSRGAELVEYVMTQSQMFRVAVEGDAGGYTAGLYWGEGWAPTRELYRQMYGGSPYDPPALENYRQLSVSLRTRSFAGPLLQLFAEANGAGGLELNALLQDSGTPTELVVYPHENHIFWHPRRRQAAMQSSTDWFNYWLRGIRDKDLRKEEQYTRWDAMAAKWELRKN